MNGRIDEEDGDVLNPFFTLSPAQSPSSPSHSQNFPFSPPDDRRFIPNDAVGYTDPQPNHNLNLLDDDDDDAVAFTSVSHNHPATPRVFDRFDSSRSSSDENDEFYGSDASRNEAVQKRLDYMIEYLDRKLSAADASGGDGSRGNFQTEQSQPLPEFIAGGGGTGIFRLPQRSAVNRNRPPSLELRPHPLRERQIGRFLRNIVCVDDGRQMWAGSECGLRAWDLANMYCAGVGDGEEDIAEEEKEEGECEGFLEDDTVPFVESMRTVGTLCVVVDDGSRIVWSGHKDGKIRCWKMDGINNCGRRLTEWLSWQAHRGPVLCMVMTSHGKV